MVARRASVDRVSEITRPVALELAAGAQVVVTRYGVVVVHCEKGWTWYRWVMAGRWWSVTVERERTGPQATREALRLIRESRERARAASSKTG